MMRMENPFNVSFRENLVIKNVNILCMLNNLVSRIYVFIIWNLRLVICLKFMIHGDMCL